MKKFLFPLLLTLIFSNSFSQEQFDPEKWKPTYTLPLEGWGIERFTVPPDFAPAITYKGVEDIRFTKGWGDSTSTEYWSYAFLWFIDGKVEVNETLIKKHLESYYDGLIGRNIERRKIPAEMVKPTIVTVTKIASSAGDIATYSGAVNMLDYMMQRPMTLNFRIHHKTCDGQDKTFLFHELSPQPTPHEVWKKMEGLWEAFSCKN